MTAFDTFEESTTMAPAKTSGLAIASLVCSLICCIPFVTPIVGILLGIGAVVSIGGNPARKGKGIAIAGITLGVVVAGAHGIIIPRVVAYFQEVSALIENGPNDALTAGFAGDMAGFKDAFHGDAAAASDAEVQAFIDELRRRYGEFQSCKIDQQASTQPQFGSPIVPFPYTLQFDSGSMKAEAEVVFSDPQQGGFVTKLGSITVFDPNGGDLSFPADGAATANTATDDADSDADADAENGNQDEAPDSGE